MIAFSELPIWVNALCLCGAGIVVWLAGTRLATNADRIGDSTGMSDALAGALLLGVATSLPEIATTVSAGHLGSASLAVNNLFGGVAMQLAVLSIVDFWFVKGALTFFAPAAVLLLGGVLLILQIAISITAIAAGDVAVVGHVGVWPVILFGSYVASLYFMHRFGKDEKWTPANLPEASREGVDEHEDRDAQKDAAGDEIDQKGADAQGEGEASETSLKGAITWFAGCAVVVLVGGYIVAGSADALSKQTGLSGGFVGATLVAVTTSLPEISTTASALRMGAYTMAISNIFGTNALEVALLLPSDLVYTDGPIINAVDDSVLLMAGVGIVMTAFFLWGLLERRNRSIFGMGVDSALALATYAAGLVILYMATAQQQAG